MTIDNQDWSFEEPFVDAVRRGNRPRAREVAADYQAALRSAVRHHEETGDALFGRPLPQILLLHANAIGASEWDALFSWLERTGHRFATADEVLRDPAFADPPRFVGRYGPGLWDRIAHVREEEETRDALARLLDDQASAWSRGDLDAFCSVYAEDALYGRLFPAADLRRTGAVVAGGSDYPVDPLLPFVQIETAIDHTGEAVPGVEPGALSPGQAVPDLLAVIKMHTINGAYEMHQERDTGSIEVGKFADLIVLSRNLFQVPTEQISDTRVLMTIMGGKVVYSDAVDGAVVDGDAGL